MFFLLVCLFVAAAQLVFTYFFITPILWPPEKKYTPVILLHGLGPRVITGLSLVPLELYLNHVCGYKNTHRIRYPVNTMMPREMVDDVSKTMIGLGLGLGDDDEIMVIGQSMGGVVANMLHTKGWNISKAVYIGSPLNGARLLKQIESILPTFVKDMLMKPAYHYLMIPSMRAAVPPHDFHTISMAWPFTDFDGCVYRDEACIHADHHTHLAFADHRSVFLNPRLWSEVGKRLGNTKKT